MRKLLPILLTSLLILTLSSCIAPPEDVLAEVPEVAASRTDLTVAIEASGSIRSAQTAYLLWQTSGTIENTHVALGSAVKAGDTLANLEKTSLPQYIILAESNLSYAKDAAEAVNDAYGDVALAYAAKTVAQAQENISKAQQRYNSTAHQATEDELQQAYNKMILREKTWQDVLEQNRKTQNLAKNPWFTLSNTMEAQLNAGATAAEGRYLDAKAAYEDLLTGPDPDDVALAAANLQLAEMQALDAESEYEKVLAGPPADDLAAADAQVEAVESTLALAWVEAPFDGTVTRADWLPGDQITPGQIAYRIDDMSALYIDALISETNVNRVMLGQTVEVNPDATTGVTYTGEIVTLSPVGEANGGLVTFKAEIRLIDADENIRPGMSVDIRIVLETIEHALVVPSKSIRLFEGERVVYVLNDESDEMAPVIVELGLTLDGMVEIKSGDLKEGDLVIVEPETY